jgi:uncharacterized ion transporter superfamily protein YfcC
MKTSHIFGITLLFILLVFLLAVGANFDHHTASAQNLSAASFPLQNPTPTPIAGDHSEVGSTDGIVIMGVVLVIVVTVPLLFRRKRK